jgi:Spy/CpxP family protein refolding chaperone
VNAHQVRTALVKEEDMFRYAYCGPAPRHAFGFSATGGRSQPGNYFSWSHGPTLGVRRPLRYLAYKLDLDDAQLRELAEILDGLKTARAQADVDWRRSTSDLAGALEPAEFDQARADSAMALRARGSTEVREQTLACLHRLHRLLDPEQRRELAYLLRSGGLTL